MAASPLMADHAIRRLTDAELRIARKLGIPPARLLDILDGRENTVAPWIVRAVHAWQAEQQRTPARRS